MLRPWTRTDPQGCWKTATLPSTLHREYEHSRRITQGTAAWHVLMQESDFHVKVSCQTFDGAGLLTGGDRCVCRLLGV